jgi:hypothetical protein
MQEILAPVTLDGLADQLRALIGEVRELRARIDNLSSLIVLLNQEIPFMWPDPESPWPSKLR